MMEKYWIVLIFIGLAMGTSVAGMFIYVFIRRKLRKRYRKIMKEMREDDKRFVEYGGCGRPVVGENSDYQ